jgi:tetratricopeptide (TPR) repeat protein
MDPTLPRRIERVCREAEGYLELAMPLQALVALQRHGKRIHADARGSYLLGETLRLLSRHQEATWAFKRSLQLIPDDIHVRLALAWCLKRSDQLDQAIETLQEAVRIEPGAAILHYNLACYWSLAHNRRRALQHLANALQIDGNFLDFVGDEPDFAPLRHDPLFQNLTGL